MNRGSALKWATAIRDENIPFNDGVGLRYEDGSMCLIGVLEDIITGKWKQNPLGWYETEDGSSFGISQHTKTRCKIKTNLDEAVYVFVDHRTKGREYLAEWIEQNYERL